MSKLQTAIEIVKTYSNPQIVFASHFHVPSREACRVLTMRNGVRFHVRMNTHDTGFANKTWVHRLYTPPGLEIGETDTVVDIGSQIGFFTVFAARRARHGRVFALEPLPCNFELLNQNILLNRGSNVFAINKAVASTSGVRTLFLSVSNTGGSSILPEKRGPEKLSVPTISLADLVTRHQIGSVDFLKMDCEGAEYEILFTCPETILARVRTIAMEIHYVDSERNAQAMAMFLEKKGFSVRGTTRNAESPTGMLYAIREA